LQKQVISTSELICKAPPIFLRDKSNLFLRLHRIIFMA
jgi:hypothetical protein